VPARCSQKESTGRIVKMRIIKLSRSITSHFMIPAGESGARERIAKAQGRERGAGKGRKIRSFHCAVRTRDFICLLLYFALAASRK